MGVQELAGGPEQVVTAKRRSQRRDFCLAVTHARYLA